MHECMDIPVILVLRPEHSNWDQNLLFTSLSDTTKRHPLFSHTVFPFPESWFACGAYKPLSSYVLSKCSYGILQNFLLMVDCEQSLIFLCKFTKAKHASCDKRGRKRESEKKKIRDCWLFLFCLGTTMLSSCRLIPIPYFKITSCFAIALAEFNTWRNLREKADCKQSILMETFLSFRSLI